MVAPLALMGLSVAANLAQGALGKLGDALSTHTARSKDGGAAATDPMRKTAQDFETMFLDQSLQQAAQTTGSDGPLGENGTGGGVYKSMLVSEHAKALEKSGGVGIADQVYRQMLQMQETGRAG